MRQYRFSLAVTSTQRPLALTRLGWMTPRCSSLVPVVSVTLLFAMSSVPDHCFMWNVRGLNGRARRSVVREFLLQHLPTLVCLQETKISNFCTNHALETLGNMFDYVVLSAVNVSGGILLGWHRDAWAAVVLATGRFSISASLSAVGSQEHWLITVVYGPQSDQDKAAFLDELTQFRSANPGPWMVCGDFNMIYQVADKNNDCLDRRAMQRFRSFINRAHLQEVDLVGWRFTWSNHQGTPTLE